MAQQTIFPYKPSIHAGLRAFNKGNGRKADKDGLRQHQLEQLPNPLT
jgi:hypothetical protein